MHQVAGVPVLDQHVQLAEGFAIDAQGHVAGHQAVALAVLEEGGDQVFEVQAEPARAGLFGEGGGGPAEYAGFAGAVPERGVGAVTAGGWCDQRRRLSQPFQLPGEGRRVAHEVGRPTEACSRA